MEGGEVVVIGGGGKGFFDLMIARNNHGVVSLHQGEGFGGGLRLSGAAELPLGVPGLEGGVRLR